MSADASSLPLVRYPSHWRLQRQKRGDGVYCTLIRGTGAQRVSVSLGLLSEEAAARYLRAMNWVALGFADASALRRCREQGQVGSRVTAASGRAAASVPLVGAGGSEVPRDFPERLQAPVYSGTAGNAVATVLDPLWLVEHARKGPAEREEVLRYLWTSGEFLDEYAASQNGAQPPPPPPPEVVFGKIPIPNIYSAMPLQRYVGEIWGPVRKTETPDTWRREYRLWAAYLFPALGAYPLRALDKRVFHRFLTTFKLHGGGEPAGATRVQVWAAYKACLTFADQEGHIDGVHAFYKLKGATKRRRPRAEILTPEEVARLVEAADSTLRAAMFAYQFETGLRPGEVGRLRWEDIRWEDASGRAPYGCVFIRGTKTDASEAWLPLGAMSREKLRSLWTERGQPAEGHVFIWRGEPIENNKHALASTLARAGLSEKVTRYGIRHSFATHLMKQGVNKDDVAKAMRHTNARMMEKTYDHSEVVDRVSVRDLFGEDSDDAGEE